ncbi:MAG TPA: hypothetical protein VM009_05635 [Terriglobales bacterium]|nr:hypothetical protein [Terriglobales bacterium]
MKHISEDDMILYHYGEVEEATDIRRHLEACAECAEQWKKLQAVMAAVETTAVPERGEEYGAQVWQQVRYRLPEKREAEGWRAFFRPQRLVFAGGLAAIILAAFLAGRFTQQPGPGTNVATGSTVAQKERVLLVAVGNHLESSQMVLIELVNSDAKGKVDISSEQERVRELLSANQLYRQTAQKSADPAVNQLLSELERVLVEIANGPSEMDAKQLDVLRKQIQSQGILLKVRVIGDKVRQKERPGPKNLGEKQSET